MNLRLALTAALMAAATSAAPLATATAGEASPTRDCFPTRAITGYGISGEHTAYLTVGNRHYFLHIIDSARDLDWNYNIRVRSLSTFICTGNGLGVQWIRYSLQGTTLMRGMTPKGAGDPVGATNSSLAPYLDNVMNGNNSLSIFTYTFDSTTPPSQQQPSYIREVNITLIVQSAHPDPQTQQYRTITLTGQAVRFNPNQ